MDALPFTADLLREPLIVLRDSLPFGGGFLHPVLLKLALQAGHRVVLLAVAQAQPHYQQVLRKLGVNMAACIQSHQLTVIDTLSAAGALDDADMAVGGSQLLARLAATVSTAQPTTAAVGRDAANGMGGAGAGGTTAPASQERHPINVFVDDLTALGGLVSSDAAWRDFLQRLLALALPPPPGSGDDGDGGGGRTIPSSSGTPFAISPAASLVMMLHSDVADAAAAELVEACAHVTVDVQPLTAGRSMDVSGRIRMRLTDCAAEVPWGGFDGDPDRRFFFCVADRGVRFLQQYTAS